METERRRFRSDDEPSSARKKKKSAPSSSSGGGDKLCIFCASQFEDVSDGLIDNFHIFILDLSTDVGRDHRRKKCALLNHLSRIARSESAMSFCALGSTLYFFEKFKWDTKPPLGKSVYAYKLPSDVSRILNCRLKRKMLVQIPDMLGYKDFPISLPTPDMKCILVFSSMFGRHGKACDPDFEMYDSETRSWRQLAGIPDSWKRSRFMITSYTFLDNQHVLLLRTDSRMFFTLDIRSPEQPCQSLAFDDPRAMPIPQGIRYFIVAGGHLCLSPALPYDVNEENENGRDYFVYPELSCLGRPRRKYTHPRHAIGLLHVDDRGCRFCIVRTEMHRRTLQPKATVNVYHLDLHEYKKLKEKKEVVYDFGEPTLPGTHVIKSLEFRSKYHEPFKDSFAPLCLTYIPA